MDLILSFSRWLSSYPNKIYLNIHLFLSDLRGHLYYKPNFHADLGLGNQTNERELSIQKYSSEYGMSGRWSPSGEGRGLCLARKMEQGGLWGACTTRVVAT